MASNVSSSATTKKVALIGGALIAATFLAIYLKRRQTRAIDDDKMSVGAYLRRIGLHGAAPPPTLANLNLLIASHLMYVPFENLTQHCGKRIETDLKQLYKKVVKHKRGGFCFELNPLFGWLLTQLGYDVSLKIGEVRIPDGWTGPAHCLLIVKIPSTTNPPQPQLYVVDVGFGEPPTGALALELDKVQTIGYEYKIISGLDFLAQEEKQEKKHGDSPPPSNGPAIPLPSVSPPPPPIAPEAKDEFVVQRYNYVTKTWETKMKFSLLEREHPRDFLWGVHVVQDPALPFPFCTKIFCVKLGSPTDLTMGTRTTLSGFRLITTENTHSDRPRRTEKKINSKEELIDIMKKKFDIELLPERDGVLDLSVTEKAEPGGFFDQF